MKNYLCRQIMFCFTLLAFTLILGSSITFAQQSTHLTENQIRTLIGQRFNTDDKKLSSESRDTLEKLDVSYIPVLKNILKQGSLCEQVESASLLIEFNKRDNTEFVSQLAILAQQQPFDPLSGSGDWKCRRMATFLLQYSARGIRELTKLLSHPSHYIRQNAVFGFDDLTEARDYREDRLQAVKESIPALIRATKDTDEIVSGMADESLTQMSDDTGLYDLVRAAREKPPQ